MNLHANAALSLKGRRQLATSVVCGERTLTEAALAAGVSVRCARRWSSRYRAEGELGLLDRSSAPKRIPHRTSDQRVEAIAALRRVRFTGPEIAELLEMPLSTVSGILKRIGMGRHGITVQRLITDNGSAYVSFAHAAACRALGIKHIRTRPYRPQTNGKAERFIRTLTNGWAYGAIYRSSAERTAALDGWLHHYNHVRRHSALGHQPPITRVTNPPGTYT